SVYLCLWAQMSPSLFFFVPFPHLYPHDWRTKQPLICRTASQVFLRLDRIRDVALDRIKRVHFMPYSGQIPPTASLAGIPCFPTSAYTRMRAALESRQGDWCLSRQRQWGLPLPFFRLQRGQAEPAGGDEPPRSGGESERVQGVAQSRDPSEEPLFGDIDTFEAIARKIREEGSDAWWTSAHPASWLPPQHSSPLDAIGTAYNSLFLSIFMYIYLYIPWMYPYLSMSLRIS
ncbi:Isoleucine-tRNA ligase, partial [Toxoplasma gondii ME49]